MKAALSLGLVTMCVTSALGCAGSVARNGSPVVAHLAGRLVGDEDDDDTLGHYRSSGMLDQDADLDDDSKPEQPDYLDYDDGEVSDFGQPASAAQEHTIAAVVRHYYAAAVTEDGAAACSLLYRTYAETAVEDQGSSASPKYQRGHTCGSVMGKIFRHLHAELSVPVELVATRVKGEIAYVLLGSTRYPASYLRLRLEGARWKVYAYVEKPLP